MLQKRAGPELLIVLVPSTQIAGKRSNRPFQGHCVGLTRLVTGLQVLAVKARHAKSALAAVAAARRAGNLGRGWDEGTSQVGLAACIRPTWDIVVSSRALGLNKMDSLTLPPAYETTGIVWRHKVG